MPLFHTPTALAAGTTSQYCPKLPEGQQLIAIPLPGAGPFVCPMLAACGGQCRFNQSACVPPPPLPPHLSAHLRLSATLVQLVADALAHPCNGAGGSGTVEGPAADVVLLGRRQYTRN